MAVAGRDAVEVRARGRAAGAVVEVGAVAEVGAEGVGGDNPMRVSGQVDGDRLVVTLDGTTRGYTVAKDGDTLWLGRDGLAWAVREQGPVDAVAAEAAGAGGPVRSPMPGTVTVVEVADGQAVAAGDRLVVVEAMKMEHVLTAPVDGVVRDLRARAGATVAKDAVLLTVETAESRD
jgi:acetyl-CoA/propionyl-CoA carboxylase biotin carboxyl carrier protein